MTTLHHNPQPYSIESGYPYADIMAGVLSATTVERALVAHGNWANAGWTMDYMTECQRAGRALKNSRAVIGLLILAGCR